LKSLDANWIFFSYKKTRDSRERLGSWCFIMSSFVPPTVYTGPSVYTDEHGVNFLNVPQQTLYYYRLPPADCSDHKKFRRCNAFLIYRRFLQKALKARTNKCSIMAKESWDFASGDFKKFFEDYSKVVQESRGKVYRIVEGKRKTKKGKSRMKLFVGQEDYTMENLQIETMYQLDFVQYHR